VSKRNVVQLSEEAILQALKAGDEKALIALQDRFGKAMQLMVEKYLGNRQQAQEIINDIFINLWQTRNKGLIDFQAVRNYLFAAVTKACHRARQKNEQSDELRASYLALQLDQYAPAQEHLIVAAEILARMEKVVEKELDSLPPRLREIMVLTYVHQLKPKAIAELLGLSEQTVKNFKVRARKHFEKRAKQASQHTNSRRKTSKKP
jgi:RNA polymerase sigma factor (sigma-70 family)